MLVSTTTPERSFSTMRRVKTYLRATMKTERLSGSCSNARVYKDMTIDGEVVACEFCGKTEEQDANLRISITLDLRYLARHLVQ